MIELIAAVLVSLIFSTGINLAFSEVVGHKPSFKSWLSIFIPCLAVVLATAYGE